MKHLAEVNARTDAADISKILVGYSSGRGEQRGEFSSSLTHW